AFFYQQEHGKDKKVLILDSHADFGGQCARNEHTIGDNTRLIFGGSQTIVSPHARSKTTLKLLNDLGIDLDRLAKAFDVDFYKRHNLRGVTYFNKRKFGADKVVKHPFCYYQRFVQGLLRPNLSYEEAVKQTPLSEKGKEQLLRVLKGGVHMLGCRRSYGIGDGQEFLHRQFRGRSGRDYHRRCPDLRRFGIRPRIAERRHGQREIRKVH
ncbi:MAG: hypothetical protein ACYS8Z_19690, partial [Planctomycetota bacterium]